MKVLLACFVSTLMVLPFAHAEVDRVPEQRPPQLDAFRRLSSPPQNHASPEMAELGQRLFFDARLSASGGSSCATCHPPENGWSGLTPKAVGDAGGELAYRSPTLLLTDDTSRLGWTGRFRSLLDVTLFALTAPTNMASNPERTKALLREDVEYRRGVARAFGETVTPGQREVGVALAAFVATLQPAPSPFDRWVEGDEQALDASARRGFSIFVGKGGCSACHSGPKLTDGSFHDIGLADADLGRGKLFPSSDALRHAFKTPGLRDVSRRSPYMHDGSLSSLREVVAFYNSGGVDRPTRTPRAMPLNLTDTEQRDLVAFLESLTSDPVTAADSSKGAR